MRVIHSSPLLAIAFLASGAALLATVVTGAPLALTLGCLAAVAGATIALKWVSTKPEARPLLKRRLQVGAAAGLLSTLAYDLVRLLLIEVVGWEFSPFKTHLVFGELLMMKDVSRAAALTVGTAYHFLNGITFAVAYCLLLGGRRWTFGLAWAFALELAMLMVYPSLLDLEAVMREFFAVSVSGHVVYGAVLGWIGQTCLAPAHKLP